MKHGINQTLWSGRVLGKFGTFPLSQMLNKTTRMPVRGLCKSLFPTLLFPLSNIVNTFDSTFQLAAGFFPCQDKPRASCILTVLLPKPRKSSIYEFEKIITLIMNIYYFPPFFHTESRYHHHPPPPNKDISSLFLPNFVPLMFRTLVVTWKETVIALYKMLCPICLNDCYLLKAYCRWQDV